MVKSTNAILNQCHEDTDLLLLKITYKKKRQESKIENPKIKP